MLENDLPKTKLRLAKNHQQCVNNESMIANDLGFFGYVQLECITDDTLYKIFSKIY